MVVSAGHADTIRGVRLAGIRPGDIVQVDRKGRIFHAKVDEVGTQELRFTPIEPRITYRTCTAREVIDHWSHHGQSRRTSGAAVEQLDLGLSAEPDDE